MSSYTDHLRIQKEMIQEENQLTFANLFPIY